VIDKHNLSIGPISKFTQFIELAAADEMTRVRTAQAGDQFSHPLGTSRVSQRPKFCLLLLIRCPPKADMEKNGTFTTLRPFKQSATPDTFVTAGF
jgi:hypothetical protein